MRRTITGRTIIGAVLLGLVSTLFLPVSAQQGERIGVAAGVVGRVYKSAIPGLLGTRVRSGTPIFQGERITTGSRSRAQVLLTDQTVFTMGPSSSMVMDEYVYKPEQEDEGSVVANFVTGVFRFLTGKVAARNPSRMRMRANTVATIGIRGTSGVVEVRPSDPLVAIILPGENVPDTLPIQPMDQLPARDMSTALLGAGTNRFGDPLGAVDVFSNGTTASLTNSNVGVTFNRDGTFTYVPAQEILGRTLDQLRVPVVVQGDGSGAGGEAVADSGAQDNQLLDELGQESIDSSAEATDELGDAISVGDIFLTPASFNPGIPVTGSAIGQTLFQSDGLTGTFNISVNFTTSPSGANGTISVDFNPAVTINGGSPLNTSTSFIVSGASTPLITDGALPLAPTGPNVSASVFGAILNLPQQSNPSISSPHAAAGVSIIDTFSGTTGSGGAVFDVSQ